jgi:hypothetical protein
MLGQQITGLCYRALRGTAATPVTRPTAAISDSQSKMLRLGREVTFRRFRMTLTPNVYTAQTRQLPKGGAVRH